MARVAYAKPDGLTLGINTMSHFTSNADNLKGRFPWTISPGSIDPGRSDHLLRSRGPRHQDDWRFWSPKQGELR